MILLEKKSSSRHFLDKNFAESHVELSPQIEIAAYDLLIRFASIHLGVACVVEEFSKESISSGKICKIELNPPIPPRNIGYAYLKDTPLSATAKEFLKLIQSKDLS